MSFGRWGGLLGEAGPEEDNMTALQETTGRDRDGWFAVLDAWGAADRPYKATAGWLQTEHGLSAWWAQKITVEYQEARGVRAPGSRGDGTYTATASKSIAAPAQRVYEAFADPTVRERWLPDAPVRERTTRPGVSARFDWGDGGERMSVTFVPSGPAKTQVGVEHARLPSEAAAAEAKARWRDRLAALKTLLEA
jgi:hypothetical protein